MVVVVKATVFNNVVADEPLGGGGGDAVDDAQFGGGEFRLRR